MRSKKTRRPGSRAGGKRSPATTPGESPPRRHAEMTVGDIMRSPVTTATLSGTAADLVDLGRRHQIRHFPIVEDGQLVGLVTDRNLRDATTHPRIFSLILDLIASMDRIAIEAIMTRDVITATPATPLPEAARLMTDRKIGCLPVVESGRLVGIITHEDILKVLARSGSP